MKLPGVRRTWSAATGSWTGRLVSSVVVIALVISAVVVLDGEDPGRTRTGAAAPSTTADETTGTADETTGTADETTGTADETTGTADETTGTADETTGTTDETTGTTDTTSTAPPTTPTTVPPSTTTTTTTAAPTTAPPTTATPSPTLPPLPAQGLRFLPEDTPDNGSIAPLTGLPVPDPSVLGRAALAVKIDNLDIAGETARPQTGLAFADLVVEEVVEGGITRFVAVLHSTDSPEMGPVRSARTTDVHLLPILGTPLFAYSGGNPGVLAAVAASPRIADRGGEWAPAYARVGNRRAPHNLYLRPWEIWNRSAGASVPPPLTVFRPRGQGSPVGEPIAGVTLGFSGIAAAPASWRWLADEGRWLREQRGQVHLDGSGYAVGPRNVVVMFTDYVDSPVDTRSPEAVTIGGGEAWVLTDGKLVQGRWQRDALESPLVFVDGAGAPISLSAGRTWIELVRPGTAGVVR
ncbi:hypothetical protein BH24ACT4_BH24ACT4_00510 [soil metagenome]